MNTWTFKAFAGLALAGALSACDSAPAKGFMAGLSNLTKPGADKAPLTQALMMQGEITVSPPSGFCIDAETLSETFALLARCDALGARVADAGAPMGVMTLSAARPINKKATVTADVLTEAAGMAPAVDVSESDGIQIFRATGEPPTADLSEGHWRGTTRMGPFVLSVALYGPEDGRAVSTEGAGVVRQLILQTKASSGLE